MKKKVFGIIIVTCLTIGMSLSSFGSVRDDLAALEKEAGVDTDEEKSISDRLSVSPATIRKSRVQTSSVTRI